MVGKSYITRSRVILNIQSVIGILDDRVGAKSGLSGLRFVESLGSVGLDVSGFDGNFACVVATITQPVTLEVGAGFSIDGAEGGFFIRSSGRSGWDFWIPEPPRVVGLDSQNRILACSI